jgi:hypothetical protein
LACQLGGATDDWVIIRQLTLFLSDTARAWLEDLPPRQIHDWDDLVNPCGITSGVSPSNAPSSPTSPTPTSSWPSSLVPPVKSWSESWAATLPSLPMV